MDNKKICCIASSDVMNEVLLLLDDIQSRIHLSIPILDETQSVVDFEVVIFVLSNGAKTDSGIAVQLKEASDLNKSFLPVIIGGNWWKNWLLKSTFKGPNFHSNYYSLHKISHMLGFCSQLISFSGATVVGDPFGRVYTFTSDQDCQIIRNHVVIAEIPGGQSQDVTLYLGTHKLKIKCNSLNVIKNVTLLVDDIETSEKEIISSRFISDVKITSSIDCSIYENNRLITNITAQEETIIHLQPGAHKLKFLHPVHKNLNRYISLKIKPDENKGIVYNCPFSPSECPFNNSLNQQ